MLIWAKSSFAGLVSLNLAAKQFTLANHPYTHSKQAYYEAQNNHKSVLYDPEVPLKHCCTNTFVALVDNVNKRKVSLAGNSWRAEISKDQWRKITDMDFSEKYLLQPQTSERSTPAPSSGPPSQGPVSQCAPGVSKKS